MSGAKTTHYINPGLISGSSINTLREAVGSFFTFIGQDENMSLDFQTLSDETSIITDSGLAKKAGRVIKKNLIYSVKSDNRSVTTSSSDILVPSVKMPVRLVGNSDYIEDDADWAAKVKNSIKMGTFRDTNFIFNTPYEILTAKTLDYENYSSYDLLDISYDYNYYLPEYQDYIENVPIREIPNYYLLLGTVNELDENELVKNYFSLEGSHDATAILSAIKTRYPPTYDITVEDLDPSSDKFFDKLHNTQTYLSSLLTQTQLSSSTTGFVANVIQNIYFNRDSQQKLSDMADLQIEKMPYAAKIKIPMSEYSQGDTTFRDMFYDSGYETFLMNEIKRCFGDFTSPIPDRTMTYQTLNSFVKLDENRILNNASVSSSVGVRSIDLHSLVGHTLVNANNFDPSPQNFYIVGGQDNLREKVLNTSGHHCYSHSVSALKLLDSLNDFLDSNFDFFQSPTLQLEDILDSASAPKYSEVVMFRVEKKPRLSNVPSRAQNFYFSNAGTTDFTFYDTQLIYGDEYEYRMFAYVLVFGYTYSFSDLCYTRQIATSPIPTPGRPVYCLEFHKPGGETTEQLYTLATNIEDNSFFTNAQISTYHQYLADFNITVEPSIKIMQIPLGTSQLSILDHPIAGPDSIPFQRMDDSQIIGFLSSQTSYTTAPYPQQLTAGDSSYKDKYLQSNSLLPTENITNSCRAKPSRLEIYRKLQRPSSKSDFVQEDLLASELLDIGFTEFKLTNCLYEEQVRLNTKYYYVLRFVNENGSFSESTNVIEAELIKDDNYIYSSFIEYSDDELSTLSNNEVNKTFKKLIHLIPNIGQVELIDDNVDYSQSASRQIDLMQVGSSEDSLLGKTFKIRLTSKKTGKKLDLNVKYNLSTSTSTES